jgi:hypothetical protein
MKARAYKQATGLLELDREKTLKSVLQTLRGFREHDAGWRERYTQEGFPMLHDKPRSGILNVKCIGGPDSHLAAGLPK